MQHSPEPASELAQELAGPQRLVFTDLDGSLLDHHTYQHDAARDALKALQQRHIPVIPVTSKTRPEVEKLARTLPFSGPMIVENGAAVLIPQSLVQACPSGAEKSGAFWLRAFCAPRQHWVDMVQQLGSEFRDEFFGLAGADATTVAEITGLAPADALLANTRAYSEPLLWQSSAARRDLFIQRISSLDGRAQIGGRLVSVSGDADKGKAIAWLRDIIATETGRPVLDLALGDGENDVPMLEVTSSAVAIRSPNHKFPRLRRTDGLYFSKRCGPEGWAEGVFRWLEMTDHTDANTPKTDNNQTKDEALWETSTRTE
ncbi:HAD-IIB family hydrolase [Biformimicrobium ophioploci]|uniref:Mannosyl-3-phosphoglycerate phosphatase-related protein n=1 Tax=Biformimicrobium ophioploci TaxID=3036711 RepID=A0ABQ6LXQ0_9GAMM|nr:HAD-IIB family hydrolase [Microbulbifer sp. NKW57]GMG86889.1 mannosyl-3-phosphoglycerate phosphatase-related protein [Microbulbifer sp. NKW57]